MCSHSRQHATCHKQCGVSTCSRPASQDSAVVSSGRSGFAWQMATVSLDQRLRINWLMDFNSINSIVSECCCCCSSCCCCLLSHSLAPYLDWTDLCAACCSEHSQLPSRNFLLPRQIVKLPCVPWPTTPPSPSLPPLCLCPLLQFMASWAAELVTQSAHMTSNLCLLRGHKDLSAGGWVPLTFVRRQLDLYQHTHSLLHTHTPMHTAALQHLASH